MRPCFRSQISILDGQPPGIPNEMSVVQRCPGPRFGALEHIRNCNPL
jgi:hypothetical protein